MAWDIPQQTFTVDIEAVGPTRFKELGALDFARFVDSYSDLTGTDPGAVELVGFYLDLIATTIDQPVLDGMGLDQRRDLVNRLHATEIIRVGQKLLEANGMLENGEQKKS